MTIRLIPLSDLHVDAERFQFRTKCGKSRTNGRLGCVQVWNDDLCGILAVWRDPEHDRFWVVNGHHRFVLATRLGVTVLACRFIMAADEREARMIGALINLGDGHATALDAARVLRGGASAKRMERQGINLRSALLRDAQALPGLADEIF